MRTETVTCDVCGLEIFPRTRPLGVEYHSIELHIHGVEIAAELDWHESCRKQLEAELIGAVSAAILRAKDTITRELGASESRCSRCGHVGFDEHRGTRKAGVDLLCNTCRREMGLEAEGQPWA